MGEFKISLKNKFGFNLIELVTVMAISAVLIGTVGLSIFYFQRNSLSVEQAAQELSSEIRVLQSKALAVQNVAGSIPKAIAIELRAGSDVRVHYIRQVGGLCSGPYSSVNMGITDMADITSVTPASSIYLVFVSPAATFYAISSASVPTFTYQVQNKTCIPSGSVIGSGLITATLSNGSEQYYVKIDAKNGSTYATPNP